MHSFELAACYFFGRYIVLTRYRRQVLTVAAAFIAQFTACGLMFSFAVYQAHYETLASQASTPFDGASSSEIDLIGSISVSVMTMGAPFAVAWAKYFGSPRSVFAGGILFGLANILASFGKALWHFQLSQGLLMGIGGSLSFVPSMAVTTTWFRENRGLAMGIVSGGSGIGGLVWAPIVTACIDSIGFRNTLRLTGGVAAALICAASFALDWEPSMRTRLRTESAQTSLVKGLFQIPLPTWQMMKQRKFIAQALGATFQSAAYYTPIFFLVSYAESLGYTEKEGTNFAAVNNACNAIGKITVGLVADRMGRVNAFALITFLSAATTLGLWVPSAALGTANATLGKQLFISFTVLYGLFASPYVSLFTAILVELFELEQLPYVTGIMYMVQGMATLVGTPVAGVLVRGSDGARNSSDYIGMAILAGALMFAASICVFWVRFEIIAISTSEKRRTWRM